MPATESIALPENINPTKPPIQNQTGIKDFVPGRVQKPADTKANIDAGTKTLITKTISRTKYFMAPPEEMKFHLKHTKQSGMRQRDYAVCRFSYPQRGQASKKLGIGMRHSAQSFSPGSRLRFRCAYGSEPQFAQGSSNFPVLILAPQQVQNVPAEYMPIDHPQRNAVSSSIGKQSGIN